MNVGAMKPFFFLTGAPYSAFLRKLREGWFKAFGLVTVLLCVMAGGMTYAALTEDATIFGDGAHNIGWLIRLDLALFATLASLIVWRIVRVWRRRKQKLAGARLHTRLMIAFSVLTALPTILVAVFAVIFIHQGVQSWFGERIRTAVDESQNIAEAYLHEHQQSIKADMLAMANDLNRESLRLSHDRELLEDFFRTQVYLRNLSEAILVDSSGDVLMRGGLSFSLEFLPAGYKEIVEDADKGEVTLLLGESGDRVRAFVKLDNYLDTYLFVGRFIDEKVLEHIASTNEAADAYEALSLRQSDLKFSMTVIFVLMALMLLLVAVWAGLTLAEKIVTPVSNLIDAAERVRAGDFNARVKEQGDESELIVLARAFNRMTDQLGTQRRDLIRANSLIDERRRFTEAVLAGVNAGVLGMDDKGVVQVANASAERLFGRDVSSIVGRKLSDLCPEMEKIRRVLRSKPGRSVEAPIDVVANDNAASHWIVRMTAEGGGESDLRGYVATFDDLSPLIDAQRKAAWADVARRVAHEIKNPLTPIQLSAERLKKRYGKQIANDLETFENCTDTIIRHVDDIRHMVDEFSAFARMPHATRQRENMVTLCRQVLVLFQQAHRDADFIFDAPEDAVSLYVDRQQISQALTNLVKNAYEATQEKRQSDPEFRGRIAIGLTECADTVTLQVADNGPGWPTELMPRLTDPYVTTKAQGNGLGLAIVAKIVEDHDARIEFLPRAETGGAVVRIIFQKGETKNG